MAGTRSLSLLTPTLLVRNTKYVPQWLGNHYQLSILPHKLRSYPLYRESPFIYYCLDYITFLSVSQNTVGLDGTEDFLVVACDGVWDVLNAEEMSEEVWKHFSSGRSKQSLAKGLVEAARREGSGDNMTVIVFFFPTFQMPTSPPSKKSADETSSPSGDGNTDTTGQQMDDTAEPGGGTN